MDVAFLKWGAVMRENANRFGDTSVQRHYDIGPFLLHPDESNSTQNLDDLRSLRLSRFRTNVLPEKIAILVTLKAYIYDKSLQCLSDALCERVFRLPYYENEPDDFKSWSACVKKKHLVAKGHYSRRMAKLPTVRCEDLTEKEKPRLRCYIKHIEAWIEYVQSTNRDCDVAFSRPHPVEMDKLNSWELCMVRPLLRCRFDDIIEEKKEEELYIQRSGEKYGFWDP